MMGKFTLFPGYHHNASKAGDAMKPLCSPGTVVSLYRNGSSIRTLCGRFRVGEKRIRSTLVENGVTIRPAKGPPRRVSDEQLEAMVGSYLSGSTADQSCRDGYSPNQLRIHLRRLGLMRSRHDPCYHKPTVRNGCFSTIDDEESAYWLGWLFTDGFVCTNRQLVGFGVSMVDAAHCEKFIRYVGWSGSAKTAWSTSGALLGCKRYQSCRVAIRNQKVCDHLVSHGMHDRKTWTIKPWCGSPDLMRHFWRGCLDGDGAIYIGRRKTGLLDPTISFCGNESMVRGFSEFIAPRVGSPGHIRSQSAVGKKSRSNGQRTFFVSWGGIHRCHAIAHLLYENASIFLDRKKAKADDLERIAATRPPRP